MPRRKHSQNVTNLSADSTENMTQNRDAELKWRDTTLCELQSMFSGSVDAEVVQLVLSESNYNVNDAIEKLFVLSGNEQGHKEDKKPHGSDQSTSSLSAILDDSELSRLKSPIYHEYKTGHVTDPRTGTSVTSKQSSDNLSPYRSSAMKTAEHQMAPPPLPYNTAGTSNQPQIPRRMPSFTLPFTSPNNGSDQVETDSELCVDSVSPTLMTSGLPDFPDSVSQQFHALRSQTEMSGNVEKFFPQGTLKHKEGADDANERASFSQKVPDSFEFSKTLETSQHGHDQKENLESFLKQMISQDTSSEAEWKKASNSNIEQQQLDWEPSKKKVHTVNTSAAQTSNNIGQGTHTYNNKGQLANKERTSNSDSPFTNSQNFRFSNPSQIVHKSLPIQGSNKSQFWQPVNNAQQLPYHGTFSSSSKELMFRPPAIQGQVHPFVPHQRFGQAMQGHASQPRFGFMPVRQSSWQQQLQSSLPRGQIPQHYPRAIVPYHPPFFFGRAHPSAPVRPSKQASSPGIPFIPTVHQKLFILIRGLPGSGKSSLAQKLKGVQGLILSTDDFFYRNQKYEFDQVLLGEAHEWNQRRAKSALEKLISPVIIDNTNTQCWEMKPYVAMALKHGYYIKFIEPDTSWKWNVKELARRNQHGVGIAAITRMKERYEQNVSVEKIMNSERKLEPNKSGNDSETRKGTGADNQNSSPRSQRSPQENASQDLGKREKKSDDDNTADSKVSENERIGSSQGIKSEDNMKVKTNGPDNENEIDSNRIEKSDSSVKSEGMDEKYTSEVNTSEPKNLAEEVTKEDYESCSPKPQRVPRVREKRSPINKLLVDTESPKVVREDGMRVVEQGNLSSRDDHDELEMNSRNTLQSEPEEDSGMSRVEDLELSNVAPSAISSKSFLDDSKRRNNEDVLEVAQAVELSKSLISCVEAAPHSDGAIGGASATVLNTPSVESNESEGDTDKSVCEAKTSVYNKEAFTEGKLTCDLDSSNETTLLSSAQTLSDYVRDGENVLKRHEMSSGTNSISTPPPLSTLLASASRTKQKKRSVSHSDDRKPIADAENASEGKDLKLSFESGVGDGEIKISEFPQGVCADNITQVTETCVKDVSGDVQNLSDGDTPADVEFLKTCFPDVESDMMNALLIAEDGNVMKVVEKLLAGESDLPSFPADTSGVVEQRNLASGIPTLPDSQIMAFEHSPLNSSTEKLKTFKPAFEMVDLADTSREINKESSAIRESGMNLGETLTKVDRANQPRDLGPKAVDQAQSPSRNTFQLTLEPAVALHLIEMFGPFGGVDFQEEISPEDLIIDVDNSLARQLYKKWERSVQTRKGISVGKRGSSPRRNRELTDSFPRNLTGDQSSSDRRRSPPRVQTGPQAGNLREIMDEQLALELSRNANVADESEQDIATKLKRQKLYEMFPGVDPVALEEVFQANRYELAPSVEAVKTSCNLSGRQVPSTVIASGFGNRLPNDEQTAEKETEAEEDWSWLYLDDSSRPKADEGTFQALEEPNYLDYRAEAFQHYKLRDECFKKAALAFSKKQGQLAQFYAQQGHMHTEKIKEANARAAALILDQKNELTDENTIDLHGLHVTEAVEALESMLCEKTDPHGNQSRKGCHAISVITGRGNNSRGGKARIKPAILEYLKKNNFRYTEPHPGLVKVYL